MRYPTLEYAISNFGGGLNTATDESLLKMNESANAQNVDVNNGSLKKSKGFERFTNGGMPEVKSLMTFYKGTKPISIVASRGSLYKVEGSSYVLIKGGFRSNIWNYVNYKLNGEDVIVMSNGLDIIQVYDGTTIRDLKLEGKDSPESANNKAPKGKHLAVHYERLFVLSDDYLYISKDFDFDDFTTPVDEDGEHTNEHGAYMELYSANGSKSIGMKVIFDSVIIFKERAMFKVFGATPKTYQVQNIFTANGSIAGKTIVPTSSGAYFVSSDGIYIFDGVNCKLISEKVNEIFKEVNINLVNDACAFIDDHKYILALPKNKNNDLIIEYNLLSNTYMKMSGIEINELAEFGNQTIFANDNGIYLYNTGNTYAEVPIYSFWETPMSNLGNPNAIKEVSDCYITCSGNGQLKVSCTTEKKTKFKIITLTENQKVFRINLNSKGRILKFRFENIDGADFTIKNFYSIIDLDED